MRRCGEGENRLGGGCSILLSYEGEREIISVVISINSKESGIEPV
jgi:hypothetical protein